MSYYSLEELKSIGFRSLGTDVRVSRRASIYGAGRIGIASNSRIDDFCVLSAGEGGIEIGRNVHIAVMVTMIGKGLITLGDFCGLSGRVSIYSSTDDFSGQFLTGPTVPDEFRCVDNRAVAIGRHVIVGAGSVVLPGASIGDGSAVAALSLVASEVKPNSIYAGIPARWIKERRQNILELERALLAQEAYGGGAIRG